MRALIAIVLASALGACGSVSGDPDAMPASCPNAQETMCSDGCFDLQDSTTHCGSCTNACGPGQPCISGSCLTCAGTTPDRCGSTCTNTDSDPMNCGACADAGGDVCDAGEMCVGGACGLCDGFDSADTTVVPGWTERRGDFLINGGRLMTTAMANVYQNHITMDDSNLTDGAVTGVVTYGEGAGAVKAIGIVMRWTAVDSYVVALVQDNTSSGMFDSIWIYEYPGETQLANLLAVPLGTNPSLRAEVVGPTVTLKVDTNNDGTYDQMAMGTTTRTAPGLVGFMGLSFGMPGFIDSFCLRR